MSAMAPSALKLDARLVIADARAQLDALTAAIDALPAGEPARLDAGALTQFDTGALAVLLGLRRHCEGSGRRFEVNALPARLGGLADLYGVGALLVQA